MAAVVITAHADLDPALAEADVLAWLEELGLDVVLGEATHLLAFDGGQSGRLIAEVHLYGLDGGQATQVRWQLSGNAEGDPSEADLVTTLRLLLEETPRWCIDAIEQRQRDWR